MLALSQLSLKGRALRALSGREHSRVELERKLLPHESHSGELAQILDELTAKGFISEERVAQSVLHRRAAKLGTARVVQEMRAKGLGSEAVAQAAEQLKATEFERAQSAWQRKFGEVATNPLDRAKHMRFLASRGFAPEVIRKAVGGGDDKE
jgi:regulatory protein